MNLKIDNINSASGQLQIYAHANKKAIKFIKLAGLNGSLNVKYNEETDCIQVFYNGTWTNWSEANLKNAIIYNKGNIGKYGLDQRYKPSNSLVSYDISYGSSAITFYGNIYSDTCEISLSTDVKVDLTKYSKLEVTHGIVSPIVSGGAAWTRVLSSNTLMPSSVSIKSMMWSASAKTEILDVSNLSGEYYCAVGIYAANSSISKIRLY